jgi:hypothetical protein
LPQSLGGAANAAKKMLTKFRSRNWTPLVLVLPLLLLPAKAYAAGGAFAVDDVEIGKPGDCEVDSWVSAASNHNIIAVATPFCVVKAGIPVELHGQLQRTRTDGVWDTGGTMFAKTNLIPVEGHPFGLGIEGGSSWDLITGGNTGGYFFVPVTFQLRENFRVNLNGGWNYDNVAKINYATWGAGFEWGFANPFKLIGEVYGQLGRLPAVDDGSVPPDRSIVEPRAQIGVRFTPQDKIDIDVIYGNNITGENAHWLTLGVNWQF